MTLPILDHIEYDGQAWSPAEHVPALALPPLAVVGTAPGWEFEAERIPEHYHVMAVNQAGCELTWREVMWWATLHPENMREWMPRCLENGGQFKNVVSAFNISARYVPPEQACRLDLAPLAGSSALFAVMAGLVIGYREIELFGVRLQNMNQGEDEQVQKQWATIAPALEQYVTAPCPGFPRTVLGADNKEAPE